LCKLDTAETQVNASNLAGKPKLPLALQLLVRWDGIAFARMLTPRHKPCRVGRWGSCGELRGTPGASRLSRNRWMSARPAWACESRELRPLPAPR